MHGNPEKMLVLCINLRTNPERRERMQQMAADIGLNLEIVDGVTGAEAIDWGDDEPSYDADRRHRMFGDDLTPGERACVLSHARALKTFLGSEHDYALVLEDNAMLLKNFAPVLEELELRQVDFDMLRLETRKASRVKLTVFENELFRLNVSPCVGLGTSAIIFSRPGAAQVLKSLEHFHRTYDSHLGRFWQHGFKILTIDPPIVARASIADVPSTIWAQNATLGVPPTSAGKAMPGLGRKWFRNRIDLWQHECAKQIYALAWYLQIKLRRPRQANPR